MTINEVVDRFRLAGIGKNDRTRRSYIRQLMISEPPKLVDHFVLPTNRQRAGKHDRRISKRSVEDFLGAGGDAAEGSRGNPEAQLRDGRTAVSELLARIDMLEQERAKERAKRVELRKHAADDLHKKDLRIADLKHKARLASIDLDTTTEALEEVRGVRQTFENVIIDLKWTGNVSDISGGV